ncbi:MAG: DUF6569 family protein [Planctomycetota bacterium]
MSFATPGVSTGGEPVSTGAADESKDAPPPLPLDGFQIAGPFPHANLTVFLIRGKDLNASDYVPLAEALEKGLARVSERGEGSQASVNELEIENRGDIPVYVQAGDIVKGGRQDRTIAVDLVVAPHSGRIPLAAFCVEHGRWSGRGGIGSEFGAACFVSSNNILPSTALRRAALRDADQSAVWREVSDIQMDFASAARVSVQDASSPSSLQLSLENETLKNETGEYIEKLSPVANEHEDAVGVVVAINGKVASAEVYGSHRLLVRLWPKLLEAAALQAVAEQRADSTTTCAPS